MQDWKMQDNPCVTSEVCSLILLPALITANCSVSCRLYAAALATTRRSLWPTQANVCGTVPRGVILSLSEASMKSMMIDSPVLLPASLLFLLSPVL